MSSLEIDKSNRLIIVYSLFHLYGTYANSYFGNLIKNEIETMWNAANGIVELDDDIYTVQFKVDVVLYDLIAESTITENEHLHNNYIRIEEESKLDISYVDGINSNTGYFIRRNLEQGTTAAHEFGHLLGLKHPSNLDIRGKGQPSIMYPRGTLVDPEFQYDATTKAGEPGGTINPNCRIVTQETINELNIAHQIKSQQMFLGGFTNKYHTIFVKQEKTNIT